MGVCVCARTDIVVDKELDSVLGVVQVPEALEELGQEGGRLLDEDAHLHAGKVLFTPGAGREISRFQTNACVTPACLTFITLRMDARAKHGMSSSETRMSDFCTQTATLSVFSESNASAELKKLTRADS